MSGVSTGATSSTTWEVDDPSWATSGWSRDGRVVSDRLVDPGVSEIHLRG